MKATIYMRRLVFLCGLLCITAARAQVPVSKEPRHHIVFENNKVRVLNVLIPPGDTTLYHLHSTPSVFINFSRTTTGSQLLNQLPQQGTSTPGTIYFEDLAPPHTRTHRVWNTDTTVYHVMDVELLGSNRGGTTKPVMLPFTKMIVDTPWVRVYTTILSNNQSVTIKQNPSTFLIVAIYNAKVNIVQNSVEKLITIRAGEFLWIGPEDHFTITNTGSTEGAFALLQVE